MNGRTFVRFANMTRRDQWLKAESDRWVGDGIISAEQAGRIRSLYPTAGGSAPAGLSWGLIVFFGTGAVVIGLGVILLFAYNWSAIPKGGKLALVLGLVAGSHAAGLRLREFADWRAVLAEGLSLLGTMAFGAGIWLVAQIYHIDEHFPNGFLFWGVGALAMAWALPSIPQVLLAAVVLTIWACTEVAQFGIPVDWGSVLIAVGVGGLAWRMRSAVAAAFMLAGLYFVLLFNAAYWSGADGAFLAALSLSALLVALEKLTGEESITARTKSVLKFFGVGGFLVCAYILTFEGAADDLFRNDGRGRGGFAASSAYRWGLMLTAIAAWSTVGIRFAWRRGAAVSLDEWLYPAALVFVASVVLTGHAHPELLVAVVFNLVALGLSTMWIVRGCRETNLRLTVNGSLLLAAVVFARYFDLFDSLAARGAAFVAFGIILFAEGLYYRRMRRLSDGEGVP